MNNMKETLEEVVEKLFPVFNRSTPFGSKYPWTPRKEREAFKRGAKWQQERSYSKEDLKNAFECAREFDSLDGIVDIDIILAYKADTSDLQAKYITFEEWFEQFEKK